jgi:hypothetical protein
LKNPLKPKGSLMHVKIFTVLLLLFAAGVGGCATANRDGALRVADAGKKVATSLQVESAEVADEMRQVGDRIVLSRVIEACSAPGAQGACDELAREPEIVGDVYARTQRIAELIDKRTRAYRALGDVYAALGDEAAYDARADAEAATAEFFDAATGFAQTAANLAGANATAHSERGLVMPTSSFSMGLRSYGTASRMSGSICPALGA